MPGTEPRRCPGPSNSLIASVVVVGKVEQRGSWLLRRTEESGIGVFGQSGTKSAFRKRPDGPPMNQTVASICCTPQNLSLSLVFPLALTHRAVGMMDLGNGNKSYEGRGKGWMGIFRTHCGRHSGESTDSFVLNRITRRIDQRSAVLGGSIGRCKSTLVQFARETKSCCGCEQDHSSPLI